VVAESHSRVCLALAPAAREDFLAKALHRFSGDSAFVLLHSGNFPDPLGTYEWLLATGAEATFDSWEAIPRRGGKWLFGHLNYEACRQTGGYHLPVEGASKERPSEWPEVHFFHPQLVISCRRGSGEISIETFSEAVPDAAALRMEIEALAVPPPAPLPHLKFQKDLSENAYLETIEKLRTHIWEGDCYEINICNYREASTGEHMDPLAVWTRLSQSSPAPFGMFYKTSSHWAVGASPERYLRVVDNTVWSQPIKGTAPRGATLEEDVALKEVLRTSPKEQAENVMIVDLTRSDLARVCEVGSVEVEELFGVYTFPKVHQLISTVRGTLAAGKTVFDALIASFPMGSMTGAPREKVMELIAQYERRERGLFSGTVGYIEPAGNADFNVVIRTVFGDSQTGKVHFNTGGAITWHSEARAEWAEMCLKGAAIEGLFGPPAEG
jgi:para-aminobenzoate synthetase component 1